MSDVLIARVGARIVVDGRPFRILAGHTTAHAGSQVVQDHPDLWVPMPVDFPAKAETPGASLAPGRRAPARKAAKASTAAKASGSG